MLVTFALVPVGPVNPVPVPVGKRPIGVCATESPCSCSRGRDRTMEAHHEREMRSCKRFLGAEVGKNCGSEGGFDLCYCVSVKVFDGIWIMEDK